MAWRNEPGPLSFVLLTVSVLARSGAAIQKVAASAKPIPNLAVRPSSIFISFHAQRTETQDRASDDARGSSLYSMPLPGFSSPLLSLVTGHWGWSRLCHGARPQALQIGERASPDPRSGGRKVIHTRVCPPD